MSEGITPEEYAAFCRFLEDACGIVLGDNKHYLVASRLKRLQEDLSISSISALLHHLKSDRSGVLRAKIVDAMTTNETYWFRDQQPFAMLQELIFPELIEKKPRKIRIWSAACSSGQEPYSISMTYLETVATKMRNPPELEIVGTDISPTMVKACAAGLYDDLALSRGLSPERKARFFTQEGKLWRVKKEVSAPIRFVEFNLMKSYASLAKFDVIFCRNVLIYFSSEAKMDIIRRMGDSLAPHGYFFLGGSESMANYSNSFDTVRHKSGLGYRLKQKS